MKLPEITFTEEMSDDIDIDSEDTADEEGENS